MIFGERQRSDESAKTNRESEFTFLDRSSRPEVERVRHFINELAEQYPIEELRELCARIKSGNNIHFRSAFFELFLYSFLSKLGYTLKPHPDPQNGASTRPDFHVTTPTAEEFYLEAVLASPDEDADPAAEARIGTAIDTLARSRHPNFMVAIEMSGSPLTQPSGARLLSAVMEWLDALDPDEVGSAVAEGGLDASPSMNWSHENWQVILRAIPLKPHRRGKEATLIGVHMGEVRLVDAWSPIRDAIRFKGARYGQLDKPLIIAVNFSSFDLDRIDEMQALYGQEQFYFNVSDPQAEPRFGRAPNGAWYGNKGARATRVSGAWLFNDINPYSIASRRSALYFHPYAIYPLPEVLKQFPHAIEQNGAVSWHDGISLRDAFELPEQWPDADL